ncbi:MAM and LDL-receptor class A domain-containing 1-like [Paramuricea clavata]|uniref:MAM and LDL-receptor class A domain-containing 1-like n=1 Tax=Paramuricea clavata TaxID=317549 RepID=A0A7D9DV15_PARCT|nr:MAM and LDL-receptor class A domain-containing 1-like [Paramuricea clavata]
MARWIVARYIFVIFIMQEVTPSQGWLPKFPSAPTSAPSTTVKQYVQAGKYPNWNFTDGFGGWRNEENLLWEVVMSQIKDAGILNGRQGAGDGFATIENTMYFKGKVAKLYSNFITGPVCMKFYFYLYGHKTGKIKIFTKRKNSKSENMVLKKYGNHGHKWNFAQLFLDIPPSDIYQLKVKPEKNQSLKMSTVKDLVNKVEGETKLLGLTKNKLKDTIATVFPNKMPVTTKREMLRFLASIYDPFGIVKVPEWLPSPDQWPEDIVAQPGKESESDVKLVKNLFAAAVEVRKSKTKWRISYN